MGFRAWFTAGRGSVNGHVPVPPHLESPSVEPPAVELPPAVPRTEPRMATDLGDALTAYWRSGEWWGGLQFVRWLINNGHMSEAEYALREVLKVPTLPLDNLRGCKTKAGG